MNENGYCEFENTKRDLVKCINTLEDKKHLSEDEIYSMEDITTLCQRFIEFSERYDNPPEEEEED